MNEQIFDHLPKFKVSNSHFRISSKIHIQDFYYAKRLFQNSFFSSRLAFIIAKDISDNYSDEILQSKELTIFGYGIYSELLIEQTAKFLRKKLQAKNNALTIQTDIISDDGQLKQIKRKKISRKGKIALIVPIGTTFSTSIKIFQKYMEKYGKIFIENDYVPIFVSDTQSKKSLSAKELESNFGWEFNPQEKDTCNNSVSVKLLHEKEKNSSSRKQKYLIKLETPWSLRNNCEDCNTDKKPIFTTDSSSTTPEIILNFPKARSLSHLNNISTLNKNIIYHGNFVRNGSHHIYSVPSEEFLNHNFKDIYEWLKELRKSDYKEFLSENKRPILLAPLHHSNISFAQLVNETVFNSSGMILHYNPENDFVSNFELAYGQELTRKDTEIIFIDDTLKSGGTLAKLNFFLTTSSLGNNEIPSKKLHSIIVLKNKSQKHDFAWAINQHLGDKTNFHSFTDFHLHSSLGEGQTKLINAEAKKYESCSKGAKLDSMRAHFLQQARKINLLNTSNKSFETEKSKERHFGMLIATHLIYDYFSQLYDENIQSVQQIQNHLNSIGSIEKFRESILQKYKQKYSIPLEQKDHPTTDQVQKVLCQAPFTNYLPLKSIVFNWTKTSSEAFFIKLEEFLNNNQETKLLEYSMLREFKFHIRRLTLLKSNSIFSHTFLKQLEAIYLNIDKANILSFDDLGENLVDDLKLIIKNLNNIELFKSKLKAIRSLKNKIHKFNKTPNLEFNNNKTIETLKSIVSILEVDTPRLNLQHEVENIVIGLSISLREKTEIYQYRVSSVLSLNEFIVAQYIELMKDDSQRAISLEKSLLDIDFSNINNRLPNYRSFQQLIRMLWYESSQHIDEYLLDIKQHIQKNYDAIDLKSKLVDAASSQNINAKISANNIQELDNLYSKRNIYGSYEEIIKEYTNTCFSLENKTLNQNKTIKQLTNNVAKKIETLLNSATPDNITINTFLALKLPLLEDKQRYLCAYDPSKIILDYGLSSNDLDVYFDQTTPNESRSKKSIKNILSFVKTGEDKWIDAFETINENIEDNHLTTLEKVFDLNDTSELLLIRLVDHSPSEEIRCRAILGVSIKYVDNKCIHNFTLSYPWLTRLLLMLKKPLNNFIESHHENHEFFSWYLAEREKKLMLLSSHGEDTLRAAADNHPELKKILQIQTLIKTCISKISTPKDSSAIVFDHLKHEPSINTHNNETLKKHLSELINVVFSNDFFEVKLNENVDYVVKIDLPNQINSSFPYSVFNLIAYELLVNAKKYRWRFIKTGTNEETLVNLKLSLQEEQDKLIFIVSCEGAKIRVADAERINQCEERGIKGETEISGIALINTILLKIFQQSNEEVLTCSSIEKENGEGVCINTFSVTLNAPDFS